MHCWVQYPSLFALSLESDIGFCRNPLCLLKPFALFLSKGAVVEEGLGKGWGGVVEGLERLGRGWGRVGKGLRKGWEGVEEGVGWAWLSILQKPRLKNPLPCSQECLYNLPFRHYECDSMRVVFLNFRGAPALLLPAPFPCQSSSSWMLSLDTDFGRGSARKT